jgi:hypothetical protein
MAQNRPYAGRPKEAKMSQPPIAPVRETAPPTGTRHRAGLAAALLAIITTAAALFAATAPASAAGGCAMRGHAYATSAHFGTVIRSYRSANLTLCTSRVGVTRLNRSAAVDLPQVLRARAITSRVVTRHRPGSRSHRITSQTHTGRVILLGQIHARAIVARATASTRRHNRLVGVTVIYGLTLHGKNLPEHPKQNQVYALPGLGKMVLNHQVRTRHGNRLTIAVTGLRLVLGSGNKAGLPPGVITIGHTVSTVRLPQRG